MNIIHIIDLTYRQPFFSVVLVFFFITIQSLHFELILSYREYFSDNNIIHHPAWSRKVEDKVTQLNAKSRHVDAVLVLVSRNT